MEIGFVGLGKMGKAMALNLLKSYPEIIVYDIIHDTYEEFVGNGAKPVKKLSEISQADIIFLSLPNSKVVQSILFDKGGVIDYIKPGRTIVDLSTITYSATMKIAEALKDKGVNFLDAPVSGMEARAIDGTLTIMCGGDEKCYMKTLPLFECIANNIQYMGTHGNGQLTKLINQLLFDINVAALAEILPLSVKMGLDPEKVEKVINSGTGRSYASEFFIPRILKGNFDEGYPMIHAYKDIISGVELGVNEGIPLPVLAAAATTYQLALKKDIGNESKAAMIKVYEDLLSVEYRIK